MTGLKAVLQQQESATQADLRPIALPAIVSHARAANTLDHSAKPAERQVRPTQPGLIINQDLQTRAQHRHTTARVEAAEVLHQAATAHQAEAPLQAQASAAQADQAAVEAAQEAVREAEEAALHQVAHAEVEDKKRRNCF